MQPANYPRCFVHGGDFERWQFLAKQSRESASPCTDCHADYKTRMARQGRCNESDVKAMFTYSPATKRKTIPIYNSGVMA